MKFIKMFLGVVALLLLVVAIAFMVFSSRASARLAQTFEIPDVDFPVPWPLTDSELEELRGERLAILRAEAGEEGLPEGLDPLDGVDLDALASLRALERGQHLLDARYGCRECHGAEYGGGTMIDAFPIGTLLGPNLTTGAGSVTTDYTVADWSRLVRHGVKPDGHPTIMPSMDFARMSNQELSDIIHTIRSLPPVDATVPPIKLGPLGKILVATNQILLFAEDRDAHVFDYEDLPPTAEVSVQFGAHLGQVCVGCHGAELRGGPVVGGDPSWPPAANLTPHADGLEGYTLEHFATAMRESRRPDGSAILPPMSWMESFAKAMTDTEIEAIFVWLQSLPPQPTGG